jgi:hypothetical protein
MNIFQPDIDRLGADAFINNILVNIQEDLNGGQQKSKISDYYISNYSVDVTFSEEMVNVRLYTESEGWKQSSLKINTNVIRNSN